MYDSLPLRRRMGTDWYQNVVLTVGRIDLSADTTPVSVKVSPYSPSNRRPMTVDRRLSMREI